MKRFVVLLSMLIVLGACTTETTIAPENRKLASELNAQLGLGYLKQGEFERADKKLDKAIEFNPDNADAHHFKAEIYRRMGDYEKAEEQYKIALDLAPKDPNILNNYGVYLCDRGEYKKAIEHFQAILADAFYTEKASAYENIGLCELRQGKVGAAEQAFNQALVIDNKMAYSLLNLAQMRFDAGNKHDAYEYYTRYLQVAPQQTPESLWLGILLEHDRGAKNTVSSYKVLLKGKYPDSKQAKLLKKLEAQGKL